MGTPAGFWQTAKEKVSGGISVSALSSSQHPLPSHHLTTPAALAGYAKLDYRNRQPALSVA